MGEDKGLIPLMGKPLIEWVLEGLDGLGDELMLTTNQPETYEYLGLKIASDEVPGRGALFGLSTALEAAEGDRVLVIGCDMPFLNRALLEYMKEHGLGSEVVVPKWKGKYEPMHAIYARRCLSTIKTSLMAGNVRMTDFYAQVHVHEISSDEINQFDPKGRSFFNINTRADLKHAEEILGRET
jgi:molybdopterin-guanine dinucleotide biosynthesis protein A